MIKLKQCPFCGGDAKIFIFGLERYRTIGCSKCGVQLPVYETIEQAAEAWNKRANPWHIGKPTEKGWYLVYTDWEFAKMPYNVLEFNPKHGGWNLSVTSIVKRWLKLEDEADKENT